MRHISCLKSSLRYNQLLNHYHLIALTLIAFFCFNHRYNLAFFIVLLILLIYLLVKQPFLFWISIIIIIIIGVNLIIHHYERHLTLIEDYGQVITVKNQQITIKTKNGKYLVKVNQDDFYNLGDIVYLEGDIELASINRLPGLFNYRDYLKYKKIKGIITPRTIEVCGNRWVYQKIGGNIANYYDRMFDNESASFLKALVIGMNSDLEADLKANLNKIGISHLFVVSGLHVSLLVIGITKLLSLLKIKKQSLIIICILFGYLIITQFLVSVIRVFISEVLKRLNQHLKLKLTTLDQIAINIIIVLLINPFYAYQMSFILSYIISSTLILCFTLLDKYKTKKIKLSLMISLTSILVSLPPVVIITNQINLFSLFFNLLYIPLMTLFILPFSFIVSFLPFLSDLYQLVIIIFINTTLILAQINIGVITLPNPSAELIILYYSMFWYLYQNIEKNCLLNKAWIKLLLIVIGWNNINLFNITDRVYFLNLPVGEAILIQKSFNQANILIDTGDVFNDDLLIFLKKKGIKRLDYLIITHGDSDHCGHALTICRKFNVKNLIVSYYDNTSKINNLINNFNPKKTHCLKSGDKFMINNLSFEVLHPSKNYSNTNNNSLVILAKLFNQQFLFTGDIETIAENDLIKTYSSLTVDYLKVAHHGSITSTSEFFLTKVLFKTAIIVNGSNNPFGFPHPVIVERLKNKPVFITSDKTIILSKWFFQDQLKHNT